MSETQSNSDVTHGELVSNVQYGYWFNHYCERLYSRLDFLLNVVQLVGGSAAAFGALQKNPKLSAAAGIALALAAAVSLLVQPSIKAERHRRSKCEYLELEAKAWQLSFQELKTELMLIRKDAPTGIDALANPSYNACLRAIGADTKPIHVSWMQRIAFAFA